MSYIAQMFLRIFFMYTTFLKVTTATSFSSDGFCVKDTAM